MIKPAFSTVACPTWTLARVASEAARTGFMAVELRTFGDGSRQFACEPALTDPAKTRRLMGEQGVEIVSIATGERFDKKVFPPVLGNALGDFEGPIRAAKRAIDLAVALECPLVRVFAYQASPGEKLSRAEARVSERLKKVVDHADRTGVKVMVENGGSWNTAEQILGLVEQVGSPLLGVCYNLAVGMSAGDSSRRALQTLQGKLLALRLMDWSQHQPVPLGMGDTPCAEAVKALASSGFAGPLVYEWNRAWMPGLDPAEHVLPGAAKTLYRWVSETISVPGKTSRTTASV